ncbi:MAG TPA: hypothetical protein DHV85_12935, partial [Candidatus Accumulibacter sp.]|nr:hypothetical protein [Accumulibacter sp.]
MAFYYADNFAYDLLRENLSHFLRACRVGFLSASSQRSLATEAKSLARRFAGRAAWFAAAATRLSAILA